MQMTLLAVLLIGKQQVQMESFTMLKLLEQVIKSPLQKKYKKFR